MLNLSGFKKEYRNNNESNKSPIVNAQYADEIVVDCSIMPFTIFDSCAGTILFVKTFIINTNRDRLNPINENVSFFILLLNSLKKSARGFAIAFI